MKTSTRTIAVVLCVAFGATLLRTPEGNSIELGTVVGGIDLSNRTRKEAEQILARAFHPDLRVALVTPFGRTETTLANLGITANARKGSFQAFLVGRRPGLSDRLAYVIAPQPAHLPMPLWFDRESVRLNRVLDRLAGAGELEPKPTLVGGVWRWAAASWKLDVEAAKDKLAAEIGVGNTREIALPCTRATHGIEEDLSSFRPVLTLEEDFRGKTPGSISNLTAGAKFLNGVFVRPGQTFSFNRAVGPRTKERGFTFGRAIVNGQINDEDIGGGACATSTLVYRAALTAGARIIERHAHSLTPSKPGLDATVTSVKDLKLKFLQPVIIGLECRGTKVTLRLYSNQPIQLCALQTHTTRTGGLLKVRTTRVLPSGGREDLGTSQYR